MLSLAAVFQRRDRVVEQPLGAIRATAREHAELIAAHPVRRPRVERSRGRKTATKALERRVSRRVPKRVVVLLKAVQVEHHQKQLFNRR
jgi:hypothetical protein